MYRLLAQYSGHPGHSIAIVIKAGSALGENGKHVLHHYHKTPMDILKKVLVHLHAF